MMEEEELIFEDNPNVLLNERIKKLKIALIVVSVLLAIVTFAFGGVLAIAIIQSSDSNCVQTSSTPTPEAPITDTSTATPTTSATSTITPTISTSPSPLPSAAISPESTQYFLQISDIHLDLRGNLAEPVAKYGYDGGELLLNSTLQAMSDLPGEPSFILVTGDFVGHSQPTSKVQFATLSRASELIKHYFPDTQVYPAMGNNDVFPDYHFPLNTTTNWMTQLSTLWGTNLTWLGDSQLATFNPNGYYAVESLWENGPGLLSLNTLMYSVNLVDSTNPLTINPTPPSSLPDDPNGQFAWLQQQLDTARANSKQVIIQYHIPPGMNDYDSSVNWNAKFTQQFDEICANYSDAILFQTAAHFHTDELRIIANRTAIFLNPSVSPDHTNNPSFRQYNYQGSQVLNYVQYFTDLPRANAAAKQGKSIVFKPVYDTRIAYNVSAINADGMKQMINLIANSTEHFMRYLNFEYVYYPYHRDRSICAMIHQATANYTACVGALSDDEDQSTY